jgi:hypothetical protein
MKQLHLRICKFVTAAIFMLSACTSPAGAASINLTAPGKTPPLTVEEHAVVEDAVDKPTHFEFNQRIAAQVFEKRMVLRNLPPDEKASGVNEVLKPFSYALRQNPLLSSYAYQLFKDDQLVLDDVGPFWQATQREDGADFLLPLETGQGKLLLVSREKMEDWDSVFPPPIYFGNELIAAQEDNGKVVVRRLSDDQVLYTQPVTSSPVEMPIKTFENWQGHWVLEADGVLVIDGKNINHQLGYDAIFNWVVLHGQPFFFFTKGQHTGIFFAGKEQDAAYDEVIHYKCCEPAAFNPGNELSIVWFYALRDGMWYYVEAGIFNS